MQEAVRFLPVAKEHCHSVLRQLACKSWLPLFSFALRLGCITWDVTQCPQLRSRAELERRQGERRFRPNTLQSDTALPSASHARHLRQCPCTCQAEGEQLGR